MFGTQSRSCSEAWILTQRFEVHSQLSSLEFSWYPHDVEDADYFCTMSDQEYVCGADVSCIPLSSPTVDSYPRASCDFSWVADLSTVLFDTRGFFAVF